MRKIYLFVAVAAVFLCIGCNDGGVESGGGDAVAFLNRFYGYETETVTIGGHSWTKKNLNIETADSWCYENSTDNCEKYGRLYTWEAAKSVCQSIGMKLPTVNDWIILFEAVGGEYVAGKKLKSKSGWDDYCGDYDEPQPCESGNGTDDYEFSALPGGYCNACNAGGGWAPGTVGYWWTETKNYGSDGAKHAEMYYHVDRADVGIGFVGGGEMGLSVRCVKE